MPRWGPPKYHPLAAYLAGLPPETPRVTLTMAQIEAVRGGPLPRGARAWLGAPWRVAARSLRTAEPAITVAREADSTARRTG
jgi:hypothetical protein